MIVKFYTNGYASLAKQMPPDVMEFPCRLNVGDDIDGSVFGQDPDVPEFYSVVSVMFDKVDEHGIIQFVELVLKRE